MTPLRRGGLHQRHDVASGLVGAEQNLTQEAEADFYTDPARNKEEITAFAEAIEDEGVSPPTLPCRHQRCFGFHHHAIDQVARQVVVDNIDSKRSIRADDSANLAATDAVSTQRRRPHPTSHLWPTCCDIFPRERHVAASDLHEIPVEGGVPEPFGCVRDEEVAVLKCMYVGLRTTSAERHECVSSLVGDVLVQTARQAAAATHTSWRPWSRTTPRRSNQAGG